MKIKKIVAAAVLSFLIFASGCQANTQTNNAQPLEKYEASADTADSGYYGVYDQASGSGNISYTGSLNMECLNLSKSIEELKTVFEKNNVIVQSEELQSNDDKNSNAYTSAFYSIQFEADKKDAFLKSLKEVGKIRSQSLYANDLSNSNENLDTQIANLIEQKERLLELQKEASEMADKLSVESQLNDIETQLSYLQKAKDDNKEDVEYISYSIALNQVQAYTTDAAGSFGEKIGLLFENSWIAFVNTLGNIGRFMIYSIPYIVTIVIIVFISKLIKKIRRKKEN